MKKQIHKAAKFAINNTMIDENALFTVQEIQRHGHQAYIVGGAVRDLLLSKPPKDFDIATSATPEQVRRIFRNSMIIGRRFKLVHVNFRVVNQMRSEKYGRKITELQTIEVSTFRSNHAADTDTSEHGKVLFDNTYGNIAEDAERRDFTVNAMYYDPIKEEIIDYHGGVKDLKKRVLRIIGNPYIRYQEDPVRVLRALRLAVKSGLEIHKETYINFYKAKELLRNEPRGRLYEEMLKILASGYALDVIAELRELKLPKGIFPLLDNLIINPNEHKLAEQIVKKTDERIKNGEETSVSFVLAGLTWQMVYPIWQNELLNTISPYQAMNDALFKNKEVLFANGVTRNSYGQITEQCLFQVELDFPMPKRVGQVMSFPRFRQAMHIYNLRHELGEVDPAIYDWWQRFFVADNEIQKEALIAELKNIVPVRRKPRKRRVKKKIKS